MYGLERNHCSLLFFLFFLCISFSSHAQSILYEYDEAGNRTARVYYQVQMPQLRSAIATPDTVVVKPQDNSFLSVKIYPNPTKGDLILMLDGLGKLQTVDFFLYDSRGTLLFKSKATMGTTPINMSKCKPGWYILKVVNAKDILHFKIIRE